MILIDSLYINDSGGLELLKYLVEYFESNSKIYAYYLFDSRCSEVFSDIPKTRKTILKASQFNRYKFYNKNITKFDKIFCFGNTPPIKKTAAIVYTYFHNINFLIIPQDISLKIKILIKLKLQYIKILKRNTDFWIVQTDNTKNALVQNFHEKKSKILILPFFKIEELRNEVSLLKTDYIFVAIYQKPKNHFNLIRAWSILFDLGFTPTLHITLSKMPEELNQLISECITRGVKIVNHGFIPKADLRKLYSISKATIYPSINESLGLGIVEALNYGCDLIGADLPYIHSISNPSAVFNPYNVNSIVDAVIKYESGVCPKSNLNVINEIDNLLDLFK